MTGASRSAVSALVTLLTVLVAVQAGSGRVVANGDGTRGDLRSHPAVGRFSIVSEVGGAVWAFQPDGRLIVMGPGDLVARGTWQAGPDRADLDARLDVSVTGQKLHILGAVSPDAARVALYVEAVEPHDTEAGVPWPSISRLVGERVALAPDVAPSAGSWQQDCRRPAWLEGDAISWDRCAGDDTGSGSPAPALDVAEPSFAWPASSSPPQIRSGQLLPSPACAAPGM
jgi:hypothetical protein